jgi:hypothetical protein
MCKVHTHLADFDEESGASWNAAHCKELMHSSTQLRCTHSCAMLKMQLRLTEMRELTRSPERLLSLLQRS